MKENTTKQPYDAPAVEVEPVCSEGVICQSGGTEDYNRNDSPYNW